METFDAGRALPKIFRLTKGGKLIDGVFKGETINTPSMLAVADYVDALDWADRVGGRKALQARADANFAAIQSWVDQTDWVANLADNPATRSNTSVCLKVTDFAIAALDDAAQKAFCKKIVTLLDAEDAAYDIGGYRDAPAGLRIWCGATVDASDVEALTPWLDWAFATAKADLVAA